MDAAGAAAEFNPALELAIEEANCLGLPTVVGFGVTAYPEANARHCDFMLRGLAEVRLRLADRGVGFVIRRKAPDQLALELARDAALVVCDAGYLKPQRAWRAALAKSIDRRLIQVEADVVVPVETASPKHEFAARTIRPKVQRLWDDYLVDLPPTPVAVRADKLPIESDADLADVPRLLEQLGVDGSVRPVGRFNAGQAAARAPGLLLGGRPHPLQRRARASRSGRRLASQPLPALRPDLTGGNRPCGA